MLKSNINGLLKIIYEYIKQKQLVIYMNFD